MVRHFLSYYNSQKLQNSILLVDEGFRQKAWKLVKSDQFDFLNAVTVFLREALFVIKYNPSLQVLRYTGVSNPQSMTVTQLQDYAQNGAKPESMMFGVCACGDGSILITGGITRQREFSTEATRLDLVDDDRIAWV